MHRWIIDPATGKVIEHPIDDRPAEFPRVADGVVGRDHRYGYMVSIGAGTHAMGQELFKYDRHADRSWTCSFGPGFAAGEPIFASASSVAGGGAEDEGYILTFVYDATEFEKGPVARVHLPCRVPHGFHGSWIPDRV